MRVPRSQRGGEIVEPLVREQWFVRMQPLAEPALEVGACWCFLLMLALLLLFGVYFGEVWWLWGLCLECELCLGLPSPYQALNLSLITLLSPSFFEFHPCLPTHPPSCVPGCVQRCHPHRPRPL